MMRSVCGFEILWVLDIVKDAVEGWEAIGVVYKMRLASCIDDMPCIHPGIGYFFKVAVAVVVVVVRLRPWSLDC